MEMIERCTGIEEITAKNIWQLYKNQADAKADRSRFKFTKEGIDFLNEHRIMFYLSRIKAIEDNTLLMTCGRIGMPNNSIILK